jgi:iron complex outermembrane receptor protein
MQRPLFLSLAAATLLTAEPTIDLGGIDVNATGFETAVVKDVSGEEVRSADVAAALSTQFPSIDLVRRSAIANDIIIRGMKKDNIAVTIDGMKIYGACPNRMDPPISHILANNIDTIEVTEGPYDVTQSGALGASVKVHTLEPTQDFQGEMNLGLGSWGYTKLSTYLSGGAGDFRFELGLSTETSDQYKDGNGRTMAEQLDDFIASHPTQAGTAYLPQYHDMKAYTKSTLMGKIYWDLSDNSTLKLSYTGNRSEDVLYPNSKMDADYDNSDLYDINYEIRNLGAYSDKLTFQYYHTYVDHPMSTRYRKMSLGTMGIVKHQLQSQVDGGRIVNAVTLGDHQLEGGLEFSRRNWDGKYYMHDTQPFPAPAFHSIYDVDTDDYGSYLKDKYVMGDLTWNLGLRFDHVETSTPRAGDRDRSFDGLGGNVLASYRLNDTVTLFAAAGSAMRVPDPKELYYRNKKGVMIGNDALDPVRNYEVDAGVEFSYGDASLRIKGFYNYLQDDILFNSSLNKGMGKYENVDATIYGVEINGDYRWSDALSFDAALAWNRGEKKDPLTGQSDTDLPDIAPLHFNAGVTWTPWDDTMLRAEFLASARWDRIDSENGEQVIGGWGVVNLKAQKSWGEHLELTVGVDNLFDKTYAVSNTYKDLILISDGLPMVLNEPGRYVYTNIRWKF